jgi:hypothetical protein
VSDAATRLAALVTRGDDDLATVVGVRVDGDMLALEVGGELALRWRILVLRAYIADPPDADAVRELYGELIDRYRGDPTSLARLKPLGDEIRRRESDGSLPSTLVARSDRRPRR